MSYKTYKEIREELLTRIDMDVREYSKLVSGGGSQVCPDGLIILDTHTCCADEGGAYWDCQYQNAQCCKYGSKKWCCPSGMTCDVTAFPPAYTCRPN